MFDNYHYTTILPETKCYSKPGFNSFDHLMQNLIQSCHQPAQNVPIMSLRQNPYFYALKDLLIERKKEIGCPLNYEVYGDLTSKNTELDSNLNEHFAMSNEEEEEDENMNDTVEEIREDYEKSMYEIDHLINQCNLKLHDTLKTQQDFRAITQQDMQNSIEYLKQRQLYWETELKAVTCNRLMILKTKFNTKRKRKNFSKEATRILNEYFDSHMDQPYPDDDTKAELAKQCGITPVQVSNWFGNKRIRFRKALVKREMYDKLDKQCDSRIAYSNQVETQTFINLETFGQNDELNIPFLHEQDMTEMYPGYL